MKTVHKDDEDDTDSSEDEPEKSTSEDEEETIDDKEDKVESEDDDEEIWKSVAQMAACRYPSISNGDLKRSEGIDMIRNTVAHIIKCGDDIRETAVYEKIEQTVELLEKQGYDNDEAQIAAWKQREHLIYREIIQPNVSILTGEEEEETPVSNE